MEIQAQLNSDILEHIDSIEMDDWNRSGRVRDKWEKYLRSDSEKPVAKKKAPHKEEKPSPGNRTGQVQNRYLELNQIRRAVQLMRAGLLLVTDWRWEAFYGTLLVTTLELSVFHKAR